MTVAANTAAGTVLSNTATATTTTFDPTTANNSATTTTTVANANADLTISKSAPATTIAGDPAGFDYGLTVTNNGPSVHVGGISVTDTLPAGTTFQPSTDCTAALQVVTCSRSLTLGVGGTTSFTVHVTVGAAVADGTILDNSAHVSSTGTVEGNTTNNDSLTTHTTVQAPGRPDHQQERPGDDHRR